MAFIEIENVKPPRPGLYAVPTLGVRVRGRTINARHGPKHWIEIALGNELAKKLALTQPQQKLRVLFGSGEDSGKIMIAPDAEKGQFLAKHNKAGYYTFSIYAASAQGLFALQFPLFTVPAPEVLRAPGCPPACTFAATEEMLAADD